MSGSINKVILVGNLGRDPEIRHTPDGGKIVLLSVATSERWKDKNSGEMKDRTEWHKVVVYNEKIGEIAEKYIHKGSKVYLEGQLQTRKWTDQENKERYTTEVVLSRFKGELTLLDSRNESGSYSGTPSLTSDSQVSDFGNHNNSMRGNTSPSSSSLSQELDDDIPF